MSSSNHLSVPAEDEQIDLLQGVKIIWQGAWLIMIVCVIAVASAVYYTKRVAVPMYASNVRLIIEGDSSEIVDIGSVFSGVSNDQIAINTELEVVRSRKMIERLVRELDLVRDPEFNPTLRPPPPYSIPGLIDQLRTLLNGEREITEEDIFRKVVDNVRDSTTARVQRETFIFGIRTVTEDPDKSALIANTLAQIYIDEQVQVRFEAVNYAIEWLTERISELNAELDTRLSAYDELRAQTDVLSIEALTGLDLRARELRSRLEQARDLANAQQVTLRMGQAALEARDIDAALQVWNDPLLQRIARQIKAGTTEDASFWTGVSALIERSEGELLRSQTQEDALRNSLSILEQEAMQERRNFEQLSRLNRDVEETRSLYSTFSERLKETSLQIGLQQVDSRILETAIPGIQVAPSTLRSAAVAGILGLLIGIGIVLARYISSRGVKTPQELEAAVGGTLAVVGQIPLAPSRRREKFLEYMRRKPTSSVTEALRNLRTYVQMSAPSDRSHVILITSSFPAEAKTVTSVGLATMMADLGKRTLVIEGDTRRPSLQLAINCKPPVAGMGQVVDGTVSLEDAVVSPDASRFDVLFAGKILHHPGDIFADPGFAKLMETARANYDMIIIDTPPVLLVPDARAMARFADNVYYVVRWNVTPPSAVLEGLGELNSVGIQASGLILSQIAVKKLAKYGYGGRYGYGYGYGYGSRNNRYHSD